MTLKNQAPNMYIDWDIKGSYDLINYFLQGHNAE